MKTREFLFSIIKSARPAGFFLIENTKGRGKWVERPMFIAFFS